MSYYKGNLSGGIPGVLPGPPPNPPDGCEFSKRPSQRKAERPPPGIIDRAMPTTDQDSRRLLVAIGRHVGDDDRLLAVYGRRDV